MGVHTKVAIAGVLAASFLVPIATASPSFAVNPNASPDFDNDGFADLVIGDAEADPAGKASAGGVHVLYGAPGGPQAIGSDFWNQNSPGVPNTAEAGDRFGESWAAGHFDNDAYDDLAIGAPSESLGAATEAGSLTVLYGGPGGLQTGGAQEFTQNSAGIADSAQSSDHFTGWSMVAGDFNGDGIDDLAFDVHNESVGAVVDAGAVHVLYGTAAGLTGAGSDFFTNNTPGIGGVPEPFGEFGYGLAAGDANGDGRDDLAISQSGMTLGGVANAGGFSVLYGSPGGLPGGGIDFFTQATPGVPGFPTMDHYFADGNGAFGDFDKDGYDDLAITADYETVSGVLSAGAVLVFRGSPGGLTTVGIQTWHQDVPGMPETAQLEDFFGWPGLTVGDFNNNGKDDLAIPTSYEDVSGVANAGMLTVLNGSPGGLTTAGVRAFNQNSAGIARVPQTNGRWTEGLMVPGDFNGDGRTDLGVSAGFQNVGVTADVGMMYVMYGSPGGLTDVGSIVITRNTPGIAGFDTANDNFSLANY